VLVWRSNSLYPAILAHGLNNLIALFGLPLIFNETTYTEHLWLILGVSITTLTVAFLAYLRVTEPTTPGREEEDLESNSIEGGFKNNYGSE